VADGETTRRQMANDGRRILTMDDGQWTMDDGRWRTTITATQQSNSAWETEEEDGVSDKRQRIPQLIQRDYGWGKEEGLHLPCKSERGCHDGHGDGQQ
jgi:hypothetical protein